MKTTTISKETKRNKIIYWISTGIIALWELIGAFFMNSQMAIDGMHHLTIARLVSMGS